MSGPLTGYRIVELAGLGPGPFAAMLLADMGAEVIRVERPQGVVDGAPANLDILERGRRNIAIDLKNPEGAEALMKLLDNADALLEGFRPGVLERLGIGPDVLMARNPRLVIGRMTGWGQDGPYASAAGHDINYIALAGALGQLRREGEAPSFPNNLLGDFGGGGMFLAFGVVCALLERNTSGVGQIVDTAMVDGVSALMAFFYGLRAIDRHDDTRPGTNMLDSGAPYYNVFETADGRFVTVGTVEVQFYREMVQRLGLDGDPDFDKQNDRSKWPVMKRKLTERIKSRTFAEWNAELEMTDACYAPILTLVEAFEHPHNKARNSIIELDGVLQPAPAPRFSRTPGEIASMPFRVGENTREVLAAWGFDATEIARLESIGAVRQAN
ncbi:MAG: CaiB/BaiF CoA transferase family protein [Acidimicrobiia bacterium]